MKPSSKLSKTLSATNNPVKYWAVVPAAGVGSRMQADKAKQYLSLAGKTVLEHTVARLCRHPKIEAVVVVISPTDMLWQTIKLNTFNKLLICAPGGAERCHSVLNGLAALVGRADAEDWVLVHDAARPCLRQSDIDALIGQLSAHPVGGLLGLPVADTMKRTNADAEVLETVNRDALWRALTPQMFKFDRLRHVLQKALDDQYLVTDEASAMEHAGYRPLMVEGQGDNIKITRPQDLALAQMYLSQQALESCE